MCQLNVLPFHDLRAHFDSDEEPLAFEQNFETKKVMSGMEFLVSKSLEDPFRKWFVVFCRI